MKSNCTILVNSADSYSDTWIPFFSLFKKYWSDCPYDIVLNTESKRFEIDGLKIHCYQFYDEGAETKYGKRFLKHLEQIESKYILFLLDDFFIRKKVDTLKLSQLIENMDNDPDIATYTFEAIQDDSNIDDHKNKDFYLRDKFCEYKFVLQGGLWRKDKLTELIKSHESPWELEKYGTMRAFHMNDKFYVLKKQECTPIDYGKMPGLTWGIVRGKWVKDNIVDFFEYNDIKVDYSKRGFLTQQDLEKASIAAKGIDIWTTIGSVGVVDAAIYIQWRIIRHIRFRLKMSLGEKYGYSYADYLRTKKFIRFYR